MRWLATRFSLAAAMAVMLLSGPAGAQSSMSMKGSEGPAVAAPRAFVDACGRYAWLCGQRRAAAGLTDPDHLLDAARRVNLRVNLATTQVTDPENFGVEDYWSLPRWGRGDCEDFVLEKYRLLLEAGADSRDLSVAIVLNRLGDNHAVLVLRHPSGDLVLDSLSGRVTSWNDTGYRFLAMQGREDKRRWVVVTGRPRTSNLLAER